jgi:acetylornithine deacetylase
MNGLSETSLSAILDHLQILVVADSSDPESMITPDHPALLHAARTLERSGCTITMTDLGGGCVNLFAIRGTPSVLFNCHIDTVKPNPGWSRDPFTLHIEQQRAHGLGACDIKGAAACLLHVAESTDSPLAILFSTDEEAGKGKCVESFIAQTQNQWACAVIAEPTRSECVIQHRGFASFEIGFVGNAGHTSGADASLESAVHQAISWGHHALSLTRPGGLLENARFNIGIVQGGTGSNVIASDTKVRFGFRPSPHPNAEANTEQRILALKGLIPIKDSASWKDRFIGPALTRSATLEPFIRSWGIKIGEDVDFWTEAALFSKAKIPALVLGPGNIEQAHAADEFVDLDQLTSCSQAYKMIIETESTKRLVKGGTHAP